ncbi:MAG TPA: hypothetical protein VFZ91_06900 [Allosphingosinicella sp.]
MEELTAFAAMALVSALAIAVADLAGWLMGLGWGHYSKKLRAKRRARETNHD